jgi:hypothetical protein
MLLIYYIAYSHLFVSWLLQENHQGILPVIQCIHTIVHWKRHKTIPPRHLMYLSMLVAFQLDYTYTLWITSGEICYYMSLKSKFKHPLLYISYTCNALAHVSKYKMS